MKESTRLKDGGAWGDIILDIYTESKKAEVTCYKNIYVC